MVVFATVSSTWIVGCTIFLIVLLQLGKEGLFRRFLTASPNLCGYRQRNSSEQALRCAL